MEQTNCALRNTFMLNRQKAVPGDLSDGMKALYQVAQEDKTLAWPSDPHPVRGPLSRAIQTGGFEASTDYGNMLIILFAGM